MSNKVRTTIIGAIAASVLAVSAIPAAALRPISDGGDPAPCIINKHKPHQPGVCP
ncbi:MAG TPA: hypothetical protein VF526_10440 [Solirubrobacteraceae bacterium]|jgi:hypothetical protein